MAMVWRPMKYYGFVLLWLMLPTTWAESTTLLSDPALSADQANSDWLAQAQMANSQPSSEVLTGSKPQPGVAITLALAPGIVIRGSGHFYAGQPVTATLLFLSEAGAAYMAYRGTTDILAVMDQLSGDLSTEETIEKLSDTGQLSHGLGLIAGGVMLFLTSWLFDLTGSPLAVLESENGPGKVADKPAAVVITQINAQGVKISINH